MPLPIHLAHRLAERLAEVRKAGTVPYLRPDGKTQVTFDYEDGKPVRLRTVLISTQHNDGIDRDDAIRPDLIEHVIRPVVPEQFADDDYEVFVNPTGRFVIGGPVGDAGLTGRKIIVDTYGGMARHGGGAFSGKDPSKVDRSAAYAARWVAKNVVAAGLAERCEVQVAYAIGVAHPVSLMVETFGTADGRPRQDRRRRPRGLRPPPGRHPPRPRPAPPDLPDDRRLRPLRSRAPTASPGSAPTGSTSCVGARSLTGSTRRRRSVPARRPSDQASFDFDVAAWTTRPAEPAAIAAARRPAVGVEPPESGGAGPARRARPRQAVRLPRCPRPWRPGAGRHRRAGRAGTAVGSAAGSSPTMSIRPTGVDAAAPGQGHRLGPPPEVLDLADWAAWRWAGRPASVLRTATAATGGAGPAPAAPVGHARPVRGGDRRGARTRRRGAGRRSGHAATPAGRRPVPGARRGRRAGADTRGRPVGASVVRRLGLRLRRAGFPVALMPDDWAAARAGASSVLGTRAAAWAPVETPAAVVVLDEHDQSLPAGAGADLARPRRARRAGPARRRALRAGEPRPVARGASRRARC